MLFPLPPREAVVVGELVRLLGAREVPVLVDGCMVDGRRVMLLENDVGLVDAVVLAPDDGVQVALWAA